MVLICSGAVLLLLAQETWSFVQRRVAQPRTPETKPWGRLVVTPLHLSKPPELLPGVIEPMPETAWQFPGWTRQQVIALLDSCHLTDAQKNALTTNGTLVSSTNGFSITPTVDTVVSLSRDAREKIYAELAKTELNLAYRHPFHIRLPEGDSWFASADLRPDRLKMVNQLTYRRGSALCFADVEIAHRFLSRKEFTALISVLYSSDTLLLRLRVEPGDSIERLAAYWSHAGQNSSPKALLQSVANAGGGEIDVGDLLPPLPRKWLYTYPAASMTGPSEGDCFSTCLNFFRSSAEKGFLQPAMREATLRQHYRLVPAMERLGDILVFVDERGAAQHACVYVADDIVFTKNGAQNSHPWVLMRLDLVRQLYAESGADRILVFRMAES